MNTNILDYNYEQLNQITKAKENDLQIVKMLNPQFSWSQMWQIRLGLEANVNVEVYADLKYDETQMAEIRYGMENNVDISLYADTKFSGEQMEEIRRAIMSLSNFEVYLNPKFTANQMYQIRDGLEMNLNAEIYAKTDFSDKQMRVIKQGLQKNLDVSVYADSKFSFEQMEEIYNGLEMQIEASKYADPRYTPEQMQELAIALSYNLDISQMANPEFSSAQMIQIRYGIEEKLDTQVYADIKYSVHQMLEIYEALQTLTSEQIFFMLNPDFTPEQMEQIRDGLEMNLNAEIYAKTDFTANQMRVIKQGLENGVDVSKYADPKFDWQQMEEIRYGLESEVDVSKYADPKYDSSQMIELRLGLEENLDISVYADDINDWYIMQQYRESLAEGLNIKEYACTEYIGDQVAEIKYGLRKGIDVSIYANPKYDIFQMEQLRFGLEDGLDVRVYANEKFSASQMEQKRFQLIDDERNSTYEKSIECVDYLKNALAENFDGSHLNGNIIESATEIYGEKVLKHVLIHTILNKSYDGRISQANKDWARDEFAKEPLYEIPEHNFIIGDSVLENILVNKYREFEHENQIKAKEPHYLDIFENSEENTYAIYQIKNSDEFRNYRFSSYKDLENRNLKLDKDNYNLIYASVEDSETNTLDKIYLKLNVNQPEDFLGHSLSVSDIIATKKDGEISYNYVNRYGFKQVENFMASSLINEKSENIIVEEHRGTWYVIDSEKIKDKEYFLLEHEEYGDEASNIIVDKQGKLVIDDVWNGFDDLTDFLEENSLKENDTVRYLNNDDTRNGQIAKVTGLYTSNEYVELTFSDNTVLDDVKISNVVKVDVQLYENENSSKLTALLIEPLKAPVVVELENNLKSLQQAVDGNIETFNYYDDICLICNEDGKINGSQLNRAIYDENGKMVEIIAGSFLVVENGEEDFKSLSPKLIEEYKNKFEKPEKFTKLAGKIIAQKIDLEPKTPHKPKSNDIDR